jgi:ribose transport system permease protein
VSEQVAADRDVPTDPLPAGNDDAAGRRVTFKVGLIQALRMLVRFQSVLGLAAVFVAGVIVSPRINGEVLFLQPRNLGSIIQDISEYGILAVGMTFVIISGGIDLSVGRVLGLSTVVVASFLMQAHWDVIPTVLATLAIGLAFGALQGAISVQLRLQAFIVTLAGTWIAYGVALSLLPHGQFIGISFGEGPNHAPAAFQHLSDSLFGHTVPVVALIFLGVGLLGVLILNTTRFGRQVYAIGGNERAARLSGIPVARVRIVVFGISGLMAALAGIVDAGQYNFGNPAQGYGYELMAIAAVVIGGTSLMGGRGSMVGTLAGVLMLGTLNNLLLLNNVDSNVQKVVTGVIVVVAASLQTVVGGLTGSLGGRQPARPGTAPAAPATPATPASR